jgi:EmrB/QacA subfamily drug resistance transporter
MQQTVLILIGVLLGMLLSALDQTVVGTALPRIVTQLGGFNEYAWVVTAYLLASTVSIPLYGKLSDLYGRRIFFIGSMIIFLAGSALSGTSQNMTELIIYRGVQGLGAGGMMPIAQAIIGDIFPPAERGKWQGLIIAVFGLATIIGPLLGGWITDNLGWRWVFYVNMPVGAVAILTAGIVLPRQSRRVKHIIDYIGSAILITWTVPLLLAFSWGGTQYAWNSWQIILLFAIAAVMLVVFVLYEYRPAEPVINPRLFGSSIFSVSSIATFLLSSGMFGAILYLPLFVQAVIGQSATNSGVILTPMMLGFMFSSIIGGQLLSRTGRYKFLALFGFAVASLGMFLLSRMDATTGNGEVVRDMIITGLGMGVMMSLFTIIVQNAFPIRQLGEVTATLTFFRSIGSAIGVAVMGTILTNDFQNSLQSNMPRTLAQVIPASRLSQFQNPQALLDPSVVAQLQHSFARFGTQGIVLLNELIGAIRTSLATAVANVFLLGFIAMLLALFVTFFLREIPLRRANSLQAGAATQPGPDRHQALMGLTLALMAREAQQPDANPQLLATLSASVDGRYPSTWSDEKRGKAVAQEILEPLAITLLASAINNGETPANGAPQETGEAATGETMGLLG